MTPEITYEGVLAAAEAIAPHLPPTPAWSYPLLDRAAGVTVVVKHENVQPTGAFKVRGGINLALASRLAIPIGGELVMALGIEHRARHRQHRGTFGLGGAVDAGSSRNRGSGLAGHQVVPESELGRTEHQGDGERAENSLMNL